METSKANQIKQTASEAKVLVLSTEEKDRLVSFFSLLIEIDQRNRQERRINEQKFSDKETATKAD